MKVICIKIHLLQTRVCMKGISGEMSEFNLLTELVNESKFGKSIVFGGYA